MADNQGWETFQRVTGGKVGSKQPQITIYRGGDIGLNPPALAVLGNPTRVVYTVNRTARTFSIRAATEEDASYSYAVRQTIAASGAYIAARALLMSLAWSEKQKARLTPTVDGNTLIVELGLGEAT